MEISMPHDGKSVGLSAAGIESPDRSHTMRDDIPVTGRDIVFIAAWVLGLWIWGTTLNTMPENSRLGILGVSLMPLTILFWRSPEYGIVTLMFFASGYLPSDFVDVRIPVGGFEMRDIVLFLMLGLMFVRRLLQKDLSIPWWPVGGFLTVFLFMVVLSAINAVHFEHGSMRWTLSEVRLLSFYAVFFIVSWGITNKKSLFLLIIGSFIIADITGAIVLLQQYSGPEKLLLAAMEEGGWSVYPVGNATRVVPPGIVTLYFMMLISIGLTIYWGTNAIRATALILHTAFAGTCLMFTFTRSAWAASAVAIFLMVLIALFTFRRYIVRTIIISLAVTLLVVGSLGSFLMVRDVENQVFFSILDRFTSIFEPDTSASLSLQWREFEREQALKAINKRPLLGVGLGNSYRNLTVLQEEAEGKFSGQAGITYEGYDRFTRYVHSSYINITVKMGIPAIGVLLLFYLVSIVKSAFLYHSVSDKFEKSLIIAITAGLVGLLQWSVYHAQLIDATSTSVVGLLVGVMASISAMQAGQTVTASS